MVSYLQRRHYQPFDRPLRSCHPRDLLDQAMALCRYRGIEPTINRELLDAACASYFVHNELRPRPARPASARAPPGSSACSDASPAVGRLPCPISPDETRRQPARAPSVERERYTVLLLDEDQLDRFCKPRMRASPPLRSAHFRRCAASGAAAARGVAAVVALAAVRRSRGSALGRRPRRPRAAAAARPCGRRRPLPTGASFSVQVASFAARHRGRRLASRLSKAGLPAFAWRVEGRARPAGRAVRVDRRGGSGAARAGARKVIDARVSTWTTGCGSPGRDRRPRPPGIQPCCPSRRPDAGRWCSSCAPSRESVSGQRVDRHDVRVTPAPPAPIDAQEWNAPGDVRLLQHVCVDGEPAASAGLDGSRDASAERHAPVRLEGCRVYVDVAASWPWRTPDAARRRGRARGRGPRRRATPGHPVRPPSRRARSWLRGRRARARRPRPARRRRSVPRGLAPVFAQVRGDSAVPALGRGAGTPRRARCARRHLRGAGADPSGHRRAARRARSCTAC